MPHPKDEKKAAIERAAREQRKARNAAKRNPECTALVHVPRAKATGTERELAIRSVMAAGLGGGLVRGEVLRSAQARRTRSHTITASAPSSSPTDREGLVLLGLGLVSIFHPEEKTRDVATRELARRTMLSMLSTLDEGSPEDR